MAARTFTLEPQAIVPETAATPAQSLTLGAITIRQHNGLYCLNDVHKASGGAEKHRPALFARLDTTQALIEELCCADVYIINEAENPASKYLITIRGKGKAQGTYACKELVAAYAAWISPAFHVQVLRVFLASVAAPVQTPKRPRVIRDENWKRQRHNAAVSFQIMSTMLEMAREHDGKATQSHHYSNEARLINWALSGEFTAVDRHALPMPYLDMLAKLEMKNTQFIALGHSYAQRKRQLAELAARLRPQFALPTH